MTEFQKRFRRDLSNRGLSLETEKAYVMHMKKLVRFFNKSPDLISLEEIYQYQEFLTKEEKVAYSSFNIAVCAFRFFFLFTLKKDWDIHHIPYKKKPRKLPVVLSKDEISRLFGSIYSLRDKAILYTLYSAGLRASELVSLKIQDIESSRMLIRVNQGKGKKDRYVVLSKTLLALLREYYKVYRPQLFLFPGIRKGHHLDRRTVNDILIRVKKKAGIEKRVTPHILRHSFATHLLEDGVNIRVIQMLLGHKSVNTTTIYTHVAKSTLEKVTSPLDDLSLTEGCRK